MRYLSHIYLLMLCLILGLGTTYGQSKIDVLKDQVKTSEGVEKLRAMNDLSRAFLKFSSSQAVKYSLEVLTVATEMQAQAPAKKGDPNFSVLAIRRCKVDANNILGTAHRNLKNEKKAVKYFRRALQQARLAVYPEGEQYASRELKSMGKGEGLSAMLSQAIKKIEEEIKDGNTDDELNAGIRKAGLISNEAYARAAEKNGNYEKAIEYYLKTIRYHDAAGDTVRIREVYLHISSLYARLGNWRKSREYRDLANRKKPTAVKQDPILVYTPDNKPKDTATTSKQKEAEVAETIKVFDDLKAIVEGSSRGSEVSSEEIRTQLEAESTLREAKSLERAGRYKEANQKYKRANSLMEMLNEYKTDRKLDSLITAQLVLEFIINNSDNLQQEKEIAEQKMKQDREFRNFLVITLALLAAIAGLVAYLFFTKRKSHRVLDRAYQELAETHKELKSTQTQLVSAEKMASLGQLTAGIAHEINNPVNFISGNIHPLKSDFEDLLKILEAYENMVEKKGLKASFAQVESLKEELEIDFVTEEILALLEGIEEGAGRTSEIVKGLRTFARMDEEEPKLFDLHSGLDATLSLLDNQNVDVEFIKDYGDLPVIEGFPGRLNQVFMNILTNAIQALPPKGGWVHICSRRISDKIEVSIQDTGLGIKPEIQAKIFEPFFTTKDVGEGTGLGLSITLGIIKQHKGSIEIESVEGQGTKVIIQLPITYQGK